MPVQPSVRQPSEEEEMEEEEEAVGRETHHAAEKQQEEKEEPKTNGELRRHRQDDATHATEGEEEEEMMEEEEESTEERDDTDLEESEEEEEESSEMDDEDCERRRVECLEEMMDLEKQFHDLKDKLFRERISQVKVKLDEVLTGKAGEYTDPLSTLHTNMTLRTHLAGVYRELCLQVIKHKYECELQGARQHLESERTLLFDAMKTELLDKIRRLEEDRQITSEWWSDELKGKKCKRKNMASRTDRRKRCQLVSGPFIVYMLRDLDILEDWTAIKKAKAALVPLKKKAEKR